MRVLFLFAAVGACTSAPAPAPPPTTPVAGGQAPPIPAPGFHNIVMEARSPDVADRYRFEVVEASADVLRLRVTDATGGLPDRTVLVFGRDALAAGAGVVSMEQMNDHSPEDETARRAEVHGERTVQFVASTPPFWPSLRLLDRASAGRIEGVAYGSSPAPMAPLVRDGTEAVTLNVGGRPRTVRAERFGVPSTSWPDEGALLLVREGLADVPLVVALSRDGLEMRVVAIE